MTSSVKITQKIYPVVLCGGSGTRLWPLSRTERPKQFLKLISDKSMLQDTVSRVVNCDLFHTPVIVTDEKFRFIVDGQMTGIGVAPDLMVLEPGGRDTGPAITLAALALREVDPDAVMLVLPSDHVGICSEEFLEAVAMGSQAVDDGALVTFGVTATSPETGYGYIRQGQQLSFGDVCFKVDEFVEKPCEIDAREMIAGGDYYWNSGIFLFSARKFLAEMERHAPDILYHCTEALILGSCDDGLLRPDPELFACSPSISIDKAVMEHTGEAAVVAIDTDWGDVGSWRALAEHTGGDELGNSVQGDTVLVECDGVFVHGADKLIVGLGLEDIIIVDTPDALLVMPKDRAQDVNMVLNELRLARRPEVDVNRKVHRPWGSYEGVHWGVRHQVKHIVVSPGQKLSLQYHHHRSEHWTIVGGTAEVTVDDKVITLSPDQSVYIPLGAVHRIYNPGKAPVHLIEVQVGEYLGEDDIVRIEDDYGRAPCASLFVEG